jgi:hypothetical protein
MTSTEPGCCALLMMHVPGHTVFTRLGPPRPPARRQSASQQRGPRRYELQVRDLATAAVTTVRANFILACHGVHGRQLTPADRGLPVSAHFRGMVTLGGRAGGTDSAVGSSCVNGKVRCRPRPPWRHCLACRPERRGTARRKPSSVKYAVRRSSVEMCSAKTTGKRIWQTRPPSCMRWQSGCVRSVAVSSVIVKGADTPYAQAAAPGCRGAGRRRVCVRGHARGCAQRGAQRRDGDAPARQVRRLARACQTRSPAHVLWC